MKYLFLSMLFLLAVSSSSFAQNANKTKPNILFIMLDDLGKEWIETYGAEEIETPNIDKLAAGGMQFANAWSMPQCTPSRVTLLTGQYPWRHGWINHFDVPRWGHGAHFDPELNNSFARVMQDAGYATCAAGKWQINDFRLQPQAMNEHGFDEYAMWTGAEGGNEKASQERYWDPYIHTKEGSKTFKGKFGEDIFTDFIVDFMKKHKEEPMMIYYPMCLPHGPLVTTPAEPNVTSKMDKHKAMVRYTDIMLKKLIDALEELKIRDNTIIVWTTDNGTSGSVVGTMNGRKVRGGKTYLTENGVNAPFIVNSPGTVPSGVVTDALIDFTDILPTFAELAGVKVSKKLETDGQSFAPLLLGKSNDSPRDWTMALGSRAATLENGRVKNVYEFRDRAIRNKRFKAFVNTEQEINEIFDLSNDLEEVNNLIESKDPEVMVALKAFNKVIQELPSKDAQPKYSKLKGSLYDVEIEVLQKQHKGDKKKGNHSPKPTAPKK
ncbi:MAG: sulfatase-like hydrolase/transferase [Urechidicola sp.]|nr:sulfatase-like hydrolase/transferase [Urechidicola sp.]